MGQPIDLSEQISDNKQNELSYRVMHPSAVMWNVEDASVIEIPFEALTSKYRDFLDPIIQGIELTEEDCAKYRFQPKALSVMLYGVPDFWNDLLRLNNYYSIVEFQPMPNRPIYFYDPARLKDYLNEILILEDQVH